MNSLALLLAGTLLAVPPGVARPFPLRLERGQEFVYDASYIRESDRPGTRFSCFLRTHVLILDVTPQETRAAFMTVQRIEAKAGAEAVPLARLALGRVDALGRVTLDSPGTLPRLPIDAPPTLETFPFLELPPTIEAGRGWGISDSETGPQSWAALATELRERGRCLKLKGEQSSGDWAQLDRLVWRREEFVSLLMQEGYVDHVERITRWRTESGDVFRATTVIDLDAPPAPMPPGEFGKRQAEIRDAVRFAAELAELMKPRGEPNYRGYDDLLRALDRYRDRGTPYAAAIRTLRRQTELARSGERLPEPVIIRTQPPHAQGSARAHPANVDEPAPDLTLRDPHTGANTTLAALHGKPVVLLFFKPASKLNSLVMGYLRSAVHSYGSRVHFVALAVGADADAVRRLKAEYGLTSSVCAGSEALAAFAGRSTPRTVILDKRGVVRVIAPGWGGEYPDWLHKELLKVVQGKCHQTLAVSQNIAPGNPGNSGKN